MMNRLARELSVWGESLLNLFLPRVCAVCGNALVDGEDIMCLKCMVGLPTTGTHSRHPNEIHERLISLRAPIERAASYFYYQRRNPYSKLIHDAKYRGRPRIGRALASAYAVTLRDAGFFDGIDAVIPVPLHFLKLIRRSYNQSYHIALGISGVTGLPVLDNLRASRYHASQTRKNASERRANAESSFSVSSPAELDGRHLLIVDDVITTGATMLSALEAVNRACKNVRLSVFSLALTHNT